MDLSGKSFNELLEIAKNTISIHEMFLLQHNPSMNIRRSLAKNIHLSDELLEILLDDPVENVSYMASIHPKMEKKYKLESISSCVLCEVEERHLNCTNCHLVLKHSF